MREVPRVQNPGVGTGQQTLLVAQLSLTSALILQPSGFDTNLVNAPGAGKILVPMFLAFTYNMGTHPYQLSSIGTPDQIILTYGTDANLLMQQPPLLNVLTATHSQFALAAPSYPNGIGILTGQDNKALVIHAIDYNAGPLLTASIAAPGTGYVVNDTGIINDGTASPTYKITSVGAGGAVTGFTITSGGANCIVQGPTATTDGGAQPGVGVGFTVNELTVQLGNGTAKATLYYQILAVP